MEEASYRPGSDPRAESSAQQILNLPTHPTMTKEQARMLVDKLRNLLKQTN